MAKATPHSSGVPRGQCVSNSVLSESYKSRCMLMRLSPREGLGRYVAVACLTLEGVRDQSCRPKQVFGGTW